MPSLHFSVQALELSRECSIMLRPGAWTLKNEPLKTAKSIVTGSLGPQWKVGHKFYHQAMTKFQGALITIHCNHGNSFQMRLNPVELCPATLSPNHSLQHLPLWHLPNIFPVSPGSDATSRFADGCSKLVSSDSPKVRQKSANAVTCNDSSVPPKRLSALPMPTWKRVPFIFTPSTKEQRWGWRNWDS